MVKVRALYAKALPVQPNLAVTSGVRQTRISIRTFSLSCLHQRPTIWCQSTPDDCLLYRRINTPNIWVLSLIQSLTSMNMLTTTVKKLTLLEHLFIVIQTNCPMKVKALAHKTLV